jgi:hypothetical protein
MTATSPVPVSGPSRCRLCGCKLAAFDHVDDALCRDCATRPEAKRPAVAISGARRAMVPGAATVARQPCTPAERALIRSLHGRLSSADLLTVLNGRRRGDEPPVPAVTLAQLHAETQSLAGDRGGPEDWASLRRLLAAAQRAGTLGALTPTVVEDFVVIWQLSPGQATRLKDVIAHAQEAR